MTVIIGVDPHKASHTAVAISDGEEELDRRKVRSGGAQLSQLVSWAEPFEKRTWAIESASGLGYLLAQQLVAAGETVVDVPGRWRRGRGCCRRAGRTRTIPTTRCRSRSPRCVRRACDVLRRSVTVKCCGCSRSGTSISGTNAAGSCLGCSLVAALAGGGIAKEVNAA